jgi:tRNA A-37 threonylcarbamoyl transferase component Bud32
VIPAATAARLVALHDAATGASVLHTSTRGRVTRVPFDAEGDAVVKEVRAGGLRSRLGDRVRGSRPARALAAAEGLRAAGVRVPEPLGLVEEEGRALYLARFVEGPTLQEALGTSSRARAASLAAAAVRLAARLHGLGFVFRDLKPPNLIVAGDDLVPVDLDDVRRARRTPRRAAVRNLAALDAYAQRTRRPLGVRARAQALRVYATARGGDVASLLGPVLRLSRAKRRRAEPS